MKKEHEWAYKHILVVGRVQHQNIYASFDEAGLVYEVGLDKERLAINLNEYSKSL